MSWHADRSLLDRYAAGGLDDPAAWSVESHVTGCAACRGLLDGVDHPAVTDRWQEGVWREVVWELNRPRRSVTEWLLTRVGVPDHVARLLAATRSLTASWLGSVGAVLAFSVIVSRVTATSPAPFAVTDAPLLFLLLAPLVPLAGIAAAFGPGVDPTYEIGLAAPLRGTRLLFLRATAVLTTSFLLAMVGALLLPELNWTAAAWVLPALAVTGATLALSTWFDPLWSAGGVGAAWVVVVVAGETVSDVGLVTFRGDAQVLAAVVMVTAAAILVVRRERFDTGSLG